MLSDYTYIMINYVYYGKWKGLFVYLPIVEEGIQSISLLNICKSPRYAN